MSSSSLLLKCSDALKTHRKTRMVEYNFSKTTSSRLKSYYFDIKEIFAILAFALLSVNVKLCLVFVRKGP